MSKIDSAQSLVELCAALNENDQLFADGIISWDEYQINTLTPPTFGDCPLESTDKIYSWCQSTDAVIVMEPVNATFVIQPASNYR